MKTKRYQLQNSKILAEISNKDSSHWEKRRIKNTLEIFHKTIKSVPAYKLFLKKHSINPRDIKSWEDFSKVPSMTKDNYLRTCPLAKLCKKGSLAHPLVFTATSGSTGEPYYFPRFEKLDKEYSIIAEYYLSQNKLSLKGPTLVVVCFGMGVWIGGLITYQAFEVASREGGYPVSIITPGTNKEEILNVLRNLSPYFTQTILIGYPPFVKDIIDESVKQRIPLVKLNLRLMFAAESFSEQFRDYLGKKAKIENIHRDTLNIYGSADIGAMAWETGISILIKRIIKRDKKLYKAFFPSVSRMPTLAQYNPDFITFEAVDGNIFLTADNALPLVRYALGDQGGVISFSETDNLFKKFGYDLLKEAKKVGITTVPKLPFVYIYERSDFSTKLYGAIIYPEYIKGALEHIEIEDQVTGKFTMYTRNSKNQDQYLEVNIELKPEVLETEELRTRVKDLILNELIDRSAECKNNAQLLGDKMKPTIIFWSNGDPKYFKTGIKQKWVKKEK
jgi:phenylacetate-CoA ligase